MEGCRSGRIDRRRRDELEKSAWVDSHTGQSSQGQFERQLGQAIALAKRNQRTLALVLVHVDGIDRTQVTLGRTMADAQRRELAARIGEALRESDDLAQLTLVEGEETLRLRLLNAYDQGKIRVIPRENEGGNRLALRRDIGLHFHQAESLRAAPSRGGAGA